MHDGEFELSAWIRLPENADPGALQLGIHITYPEGSGRSDVVKVTGHRTIVPEDGWVQLKGRIEIARSEAADAQEFRFVIMQPDSGGGEKEIFMTGIERVGNTFAGKPVDRIPAGEEFWQETINKWADEGHVGSKTDMGEHFGLDLDRAGLVNWYADPGFGHKVLEEDEDTILLLDGNGAKLRQYKKKAGGLEHADFMVKDRETWEEYARPRLLELNRNRIPWDDYRKKKEAAEKRQIHFSNDGFGPFEMMQRLCGHEILLLNMAMDPDWIRDMVMVYTEFNILHFETLFSEAGLPKSTWIAEDLGYKLTPFMSPAMFREIMLPGYVRLFDYLHGRGLKVIMHSCGYIEPLLPDLIGAGLDCLEGMEYKAGMDLPALFRKFGDELVYFGNIDVRVLESNDEAAVCNELNSKITPVLQGGGRYILHSDHSISPGVEYETFRKYLDTAAGLT